MSSVKPAPSKASTWQRSVNGLQRTHQGGNLTQVGDPHQQCALYPTTLTGQTRLDTTRLSSASYIADTRVVQAHVTMTRVPRTFVFLGFRRFSMTCSPFTSLELAARSSFLERYRPALLLIKVCGIQRARNEHHPNITADQASAKECARRRENGDKDRFDCTTSTIFPLKLSRDRRGHGRA